MLTKIVKFLIQIVCQISEIKKNVRNSDILTFFYSIVDNNYSASVADGI